MTGETQKYGLYIEYIKKLCDVFKTFPQVEEVWLYGSRARGDFKAGSDIDLAVKAPEMNFDDFLLLRGKLDDLPLLFKIDVLHWDTLEKKELLQKIKEESVLFYEKEKK